LLRSSWFVRGHDFLLVAFRSPGSVIAHASYPPLVSTSVAVSWQLTGNHTDRVGVVVIALLNATATMATAWVMVEAGRNVARRQGGKRASLIAQGAGVVSAVLFVFVAFGVFGPFSTNGYADPLWSVAAAGAIGYGLILPPTQRYAGASAILLAVSGLTKTEGTATAIVLLILITLRYSLHAHAAPQEEGSSERRSTRISVLSGAVGAKWRSVVAGAMGLVCLSGWPILAIGEDASRDANTSGTREGTWVSRIHLTVSAMGPYLHVLLLAAPLALVGGLLLRRYRERARLGNDAWAWLGLLGGLSVVAASYITGPGNTAFWLLTSVHRTTMFAATAAWLIISMWAVAAASTSREGTATNMTKTLSATAPERDISPTLATQGGP
jgi:hypothetical protein